MLVLDNPLEYGHAAWVWVDIRGMGKRWELAVPAEDDLDGERMILFPLCEDFSDCLEGYAGHVMRKVSIPDLPPTAEELELVDEYEADLRAARATPTRSE